MAAEQLPVPPNDQTAEDTASRGRRSKTDNYPKCVVGMDTAFGEDIDGIRRLHLADFLLGES